MCFSETGVSPTDTMKHKIQIQTHLVKSILSGVVCPDFIKQKTTLAKVRHTAADTLSHTVADVELVGL